MVSIIHEISRLAIPNECTGGIDRRGILQGRLWPNGAYGLSVRRSEGLTERIQHEDSEAMFLREHDLPLTLSVPLNSHSEAVKPKAKRGTGGMTTLGKRMVESGLYLLDRVYKRERLSFCTLTLPRVTQHEGWKLSTFWAEIVRVFFQRLTRFLGRAGLPRRYVYVTEMQPRRSRSEGHPALHLHFVFVGRFMGGPWIVSTDKMVGMWSSVIESYIGGERYYVKKRVLEPIKKSVESYMGKYLSKGSDVSGFQPDDDIPYSLPSSWWGMDNGLRNRIKKTTITNPKALLVIYQAHGREDTQEMFRYQGEYRRETNMGAYTLGIYGRLTERENRDLRDVEPYL